jgi:hypothetical protein
MSKVRHYGISAFLGSALFLAGCAQTPMGPTVNVMPNPNVPLSVFAADQAGCKGFAEQSVAGQAQSANNQAVGAAVLTTALGTGLGAAVGGGRGAGIGAASGAAVGTGIGASQSSNAQYSIQQQYDNAYAQCMYSKGHQVPGYAPIATEPPPPPPIARGPDPALTRAVQSELIRLNYMGPPADGAFGPQTSSAIRSFEAANGLPQDGAPSGRLLARLQATPGGATSAASPGWVQPVTKTQ